MWVAAGVGFAPHSHSRTQVFESGDTWFSPLWPQSPSLAPLSWAGRWGERKCAGDSGGVSLTSTHTPLARAHSVRPTPPQGRLGNVSPCAPVERALGIRDRHESLLRGWPLFSILFLLQETSWHHHEKGCSEAYGPDGKPGPWIHHV